MPKRPLIAFDALEAPDRENYEVEVPMKRLTLTVAVGFFAMSVAPAQAEPPRRTILIDPSILTKLPPVSQSGSRTQSAPPEALPPPPPPSRPSSNHPIDPSGMERDGGFSHEALLNQRLDKLEELIGELTQQNAEIKQQNAELKQELDQVGVGTGNTYKLLIDYERALRPYSQHGYNVTNMMEGVYQKVVLDKVCD